MIKFTDLDYNERVEHGIVLVDIFGEWCGPCKLLKPIIEEASLDYVGKVTFGKIDVDENPETLKRLGVRNIPTILIYKNGTIVEKHVGMASKAQLKELIDKHLN